MDDNNLDYNFGHGFVQNRSVSRVVSTFDELSERGSKASSLMMWSRAKEQWFHFNLGWTAIRVACTDKQMFALGREGQFLVADAGGMRPETIDASQELAFNDLGLVDGALVAVGADGAGYRRGGPGDWARLDSGDAGSCEFVSICAAAPQVAVVASATGELWRLKDGRFSLEHTADSARLTALAKAEPNRVYAAGEHGLLLARIDGEWGRLDQPSVNQTLLSLQWYRDELYAASESALYKLDADGRLQLTRVWPGGPWSFGHLHANDGVLWSFGQKHIFWTEDGDQWHHVTPSYKVVDPTSAGSQTGNNACCHGGLHSS